MSPPLAISVPLDVALIVALARLAGALFRHIGQPAVVGEILFGVLAIPHVFDAVAPELASGSARSALKAIGLAVLVGFIFVVGLEIDRARLRRARGVSRIALSSALVPFGTGVLLAVTVLANERAPDTAGSPGQFAILVGAALSITAFPVLARILAERRMDQTDLGTMALACSALNDLLAWALIAILIASLDAQSAGGIVASLVPLLALGALIAWPIRWWVLRPLASAGPFRTCAVTLVTLAACAGGAAALGTDPILGAFLLGFAWPRHQRVGADDLRRRALPLVRPLLPLAFVAPCLGVELSGLGEGGLATCALITLAATASKLGAVAGAAHLTGMAPRPVLTLGVLMNTRGLMELVVLNIALGAGLLDGQLYTAFVLMALITTMLTSPAIALLHRSPRTQPAPVAGIDGWLVTHPIRLRGRP